MIDYEGKVKICENLMHACLQKKTKGEMVDLINLTCRQAVMEWGRVDEQAFIEVVECFVETVLKHKTRPSDVEKETKRRIEVTTDLVDAALETFCNIKSFSRHGTWIHSLSHFMEKLWKLQMIDWVKKLHLATFEGRVRPEHHDCTERLVSFFFEHARFDDDPIDFHFTVERLDALLTVRTDYRGFFIKILRKQIEAGGRFPTEAAFREWKAQQVKLAQEEEEMESKEEA